MTPDLTATDRDGLPVLIVSIRGEPASERDWFDLIGQLKATTPPVPYGMIVDPETIGLVEGSCEDPRSCVIAIPARNVLRHYGEGFAGQDTEYGSKWVFQIYLKSLALAWLRDLADRWKTNEPPAMQELGKAGLLERLEGGDTIDEALASGHALP